METPDTGQTNQDSGVVDPPPAANAGTTSSWGAGATTTPRAATGPDLTNIGNRVDSLTAGLESSSAANAAQGWVAPLEQIGRQYVAWIGAALVFIGIWLPAKTYSYSGSINGISIGGADFSWSFWSYNALWGIVLILLVAITAFAALQHDYRLLWVTGGAIAIVEIVNLVFTFSAPSPLSAHPSYGWIFLIIGLLGILAAAVMRPNPAEPRGDALAYVQNMMNSNRA